MPRVVVVLAGLLLALLAPAAVAAAEPVTNLTPPTADGTAAYRSRLVAGPGTWSATAPTYTYQWLRDGRDIAGATGSSYRLGLEDIGTDVAVRVTATQDGESGSAVSAERRVAPGDPRPRGASGDQRDPALPAPARGLGAALAAERRQGALPVAA